MAAEKKTLQEWLKLTDGAPLSGELNRELNEFLSTEGIEYPQGALSAYMIKKEILKGNLKAIRLEAKVKGEYIGEQKRKGKALKERNSLTPEDEERDKEEQRFFEELEENIRKVKTALGEPVEAEEKSLQEWLFFIDSHKAPEGLQEDMNRVLNTQGVEYKIDALSIYILRREIMKGDLNAIRLESSIRGTIKGEAPRRKRGVLYKFDKMREFEALEERYEERSKKEHLKPLKALLGKNSNE